MDNQESFSGPNFTITPNVLIDYWQRRISPAALSVMLVLCRKIFGWHKGGDQISLSQLETFTGLCRNTILRALKELKSYNLIVSTKNKDCDGGDVSTYYSIAIHKPTEIEGLEDQNLHTPCSESAHPRVQNLHTPPVQKMNPPGVQKMNPQKKDSSKERSKEEERKQEKKEDPADAGGAASRASRVSVSSKNSPIEEERAPHVQVNDRDHEALVTEFGISKTEAAYQRLSEYKVQTPKSRWKKNDYLSIKRWVIKAVEEQCSRITFSKGKSRITPEYASQLNDLPF